MTSRRTMNTTVKSMRRIERADLLPRLPAPGKSTRSNELKEVEAFIRSLGGKPMSTATKRRLAKAGCLGMPDE